MPPPPYNSKGFKRFQLGFTLAEVLITLTIIGIIAALTVPTLMRKYQEHQTVVAVKEAYSILSQAFKMAVAQNGPVNTWDLGKFESVEGTQRIRDYIISYLKVETIDTEKLKKEYALYPNISTLSGQVVPDNGYFQWWFQRAKLQNGMVLFFHNNETNITITADINGPKPPNKLGGDMFIFVGTDRLTPGGNTSLSLCNLKSTDVNNGAFCTAWVLYKGNMDYLRRQVSWDE